jgi:hypothetical protein
MVTNKNTRSDNKPICDPLPSKLREATTNQNAQVPSSTT